MRRTEALRSPARERRLSRTDLVLPGFVVEGTGVREAVGSMAGVERLSAELFVEEAKAVRDLCIPTVLLFGVPSAKDARGSGADAPDGVVQRAVGGSSATSPSSAS